MLPHKALAGVEHATCWSQVQCPNHYTIVVIVSGMQLEIAYSAVRRPHHPQNWFWAISIASGSVRLWDLRPCCMVLSHVMRRRPHGLLQSSGGTVDRIVLASVLSSIHAMCPKRVRWHDHHPITMLLACNKSHFSNAQVFLLDRPVWDPA